MDWEAKINQADGIAAGYPLGTLNFGSNWHPTSTKTQELKARYEAHNDGASWDKNFTLPIMLSEKTS